MRDHSAPLECALTLNVARQVYGALLRRAALVWPLILELHSMQILVPKRAAIRFAADKAASSAYSEVGDFDQTCEDYEEEFARRCLSSTDGKSFVFKPFFADWQETGLSELELSLLGGCEINSLSSLEAFAAPATELAQNPEPVQAITGFEEHLLIRGYQTECLEIINALRTLSTSLTYTRGYLSEIRSTPKMYAIADKDDDRIKELVTALSELCILPLQPQPARFFGTEAARVNPVKYLTSTMALAIIEALNGDSA